MSIIKTRTHKGQTGGGGSHLTTDEKVRTSGAVQPPFIIGENTTYAGSNGIWAYDNKSDITFYQSNYKTLFLAINSTYTFNSNEEAFVVGGFNTTFNIIGQCVLDGCYFLVRSSSIQSTRNGTETHTYDYALRGVTTGGCRCSISTADSWNTNLEERNAHYVWNRGVVTMGLWADFSGANSGVCIFGDTATYEVDNTGVLICGRPALKKQKNSEGAVQITTRERNTRGIMIFGSGIKEDGSSADNNQTPARLVFPSDKAFQANIEGCLKLDNSCNIVDADGTPIVTNGKLVAK